MEARTKATKKKGRGSTEPKPLPPYVFPGRGGVRMTDFDKALAAAVKAAGVVRDGQPMHLTPHLLRKSHATWLNARGVDDSVLQSRLGHTPGSKVTRTTYVHSTTEAERGAVLDLSAERAKRPSTTDRATTALAAST